jgi:hypothetical protein
MLLSTTILQDRSTTLPSHRFTQNQSRLFFTYTSLNSSSDLVR